MLGDSDFSMHVSYDDNHMDITISNLVFDQKKHEITHATVTIGQSAFRNG